MSCHKSQSSATTVFRFREEQEREGVEVEFTLLYSGPLPSNGNGRDKHKIRKIIHPQLKTLWQVQSPLREIAHVPNPNAPQGIIEAIANQFSRCAFRFVPVVSKTMALAASLDILFLRREDPGSLIKSGGDIDNRLKTLFDALRMPANCDELRGSPPTEGEDPFYVLLEDDSLITEVKITTRRLLVPIREVDDNPNNVSLIIGVKTEVVGLAAEARLLFG